MKTLSVRLPDDLYDALRQAAVDQHRSINAIIVRVLKANSEVLGSDDELS